jgi:uncharacterized damage-inducible protein DinB
MAESKIDGLKLAPPEGFTREVGTLVAMMNYTRWTTLRVLDDLTIEQLDWLPPEGGNSIGALLTHIAAVEAVYQVRTFEGRQPDEAFLKRWGAALKLGEAGQRIRGHDLAHYLNLLKETRGMTLRELAARTDAWLSEEMPLWNTMASMRFCWFHVMEDELNHRGQLRVLRRRLNQESAVLPVASTK